MSREFRQFQASMINDIRPRLSKPKGVLAVMDAACCVLAMSKSADPKKQLQQARSAVERLVEKADNAALVLHNAIASGEISPRYGDIHAELRAAISAVHGD